jgi:putative flavoprotein involved in K+ transport
VSHPGAHVLETQTTIVHETIVVGAGPAGLGVAATLKRLGIAAVVVDRYGIGASFLRWPEGMRLITPSFTGNQFGLVDLNAITPDTSPALSLVDEHPTGAAYAAYLEMVASLEQLDVRAGVEVIDVREAPDGHLAVHVAGQAPWLARSVVWAAGELQYPTTGGFPGAEHTVPTVTVDHWAARPGPRAVVIGGYESGIDAAVNLIECGREVTVIDRDAPWDTVDADPSRTLSPYTHGRLRAAYATDRLTLVTDEITAVTRNATAAQHVVHTARGETFVTDGPPLLATGFEGSVTVVADRFAFDERGRVIVTEEADESTVVPGLHLAGPMLAHREAIFCFIYKFRQRFAVVAAGIGTRLGVDTSPLKVLREHGFYLDDLSCCDDACVC